MIGVPGEDRRGPVQLFREHDASELMGPGHASERKRVHGPRREIGGMAVGTAEREDNLPMARIAQVGEPIGKSFGGKMLAALVEQYQDATLCQRRGQSLGFFALAQVGAVGATFGDLGEPGPFKADGRACLCEAFEIAGRQLPLGPRLHAAHSMDGNAHDFRESGSMNRLFLQVGCQPHLLEVVELANLGPEDVDDDVPGIDQHPVGAAQTLDARLSHPGVLDGA